MVDTDETLRIDAGFDSMRSILQITGALAATAALAWLTTQSIHRGRTQALQAEAPARRGTSATAKRWKKSAAPQLTRSRKRDAADAAYRRTPQAIEMERLRQEDLKQLLLRINEQLNGSRELGRALKESRSTRGGPTSRPPCATAHRIRRAGATYH